MYKQNKKFDYVYVLRGISVLLVIFFHLGFFSNGFLGVDFFFLISGFLITKVIEEKYLFKNNGFSEFLKNRFRRIYPALIFSIIFSIILLFPMLSPNELRDFGQSILASIFSVSNMLFYTESGYYDRLSELKPLLHTWSISIEFQFYIFLIFSYFFFKNRKYTYLIFSLFGFLSFILLNFKDLNLLKFYYGDKNLSIIDFYLLSSRLWEFFLGSLFYKISKKNFFNNFFSNKIYSTINFFIIFFIILFFNFYNHPNFSTFVLLFFFSLVLLFGQYNSLPKIIFNNSFLNFTGKISYSLFLYHYIILVFFKFFFFEKLNTFLNIIVILLSYIISFFSFRYVENPYYFNSALKKNTNYKILLIILILASLILGFFFNYNENFKLKFFKGKSIIKISSEIKDLDIDREKHFKELKDISYLHLQKKTFLSNQKIKIFIIGDSHALDVFYSLQLNKDLFKNHEFVYFDSFHCIKNDNDCDYNKSFYVLENNKNFKKSNYVIIAQQYTHQMITKKTLALIKNFFEIKHNKKLFIMTHAPVYYVGNLDPITTYLLRKNIISKNWLNFTNDGLKNFVYTILKSGLVNQVKKLKENLNNLGINMIDRFNLYCNSKDEKCLALTKNNKKLYSDHSHLTIEGMKWFGKILYDNKLIPLSR